jgi:glutamate synthase (NADPH/NADH) large chain
LAQYYLNLAHEVREILAWLGVPTLRQLRGRADLLQLINHGSIVGRLDMRGMLRDVEETVPADPVYLEADFSIDDRALELVRERILFGRERQVVIEGPEYKLNNRNKTVGGQLGTDIERTLNYDDRATAPHANTNDRGRRTLPPDSVILRTTGSAGQSYGAFSNSGMRMEHRGTVNDGAGKSMTGGTLVVQNPGGGSSAQGENVLVGNFACFGATGGFAFFAGEAGDRFAVRNSGITAVVEGVGEFGCEYMTNGTVVNLGACGMGFGNGMSGGMAFQYDPDGTMATFANAASVALSPATTDDDLHAALRPILRDLIERHHAATGSECAAALLGDWEAAVAAFVVVIPRALFDKQSAARLSETLTRKQLVDELAVAMATYQTDSLKGSWDDEAAVEGGVIPAYGEADTELTFRLLNRYAVLHRAQEVATAKLRKSPTIQVEQVHVDRYAKHLVRAKEFILLDALTKDTKEALAHFSDAELAVLLADKRLADYRLALELRDIYDLQAMPMTAWILYQDRSNHAVMTDIPSFDRLLATRFTNQLVELVA